MKNFSDIQRQEFKLQVYTIGVTFPNLFRMVAHLEYQNNFMSPGDKQKSLAGNTRSPQIHWATLRTERINATQCDKAHQFGTIKVTHNKRKLCPEERMRY